MLEKPTVVPYPYPQGSLVLSRPATMLQGFFLLFGCVKRPFCVRKWHGGGGDTLILDRGYSLAKLPRFFEGAEKLGEHSFRTFELS